MTLANTITQISSVQSTNTICRGLALHGFLTVRAMLLNGRFQGLWCRVLVHRGDRSLESTFGGSHASFLRVSLSGHPAPLSLTLGPQVLDRHFPVSTHSRPVLTTNKRRETEKEGEEGEPMDVSFFPLKHTAEKGQLWETAGRELFLRLFL